MRQDKAKLHDEESGFKMYKKHEDDRNSASSQAHKYIIRDQGDTPRFLVVVTLSSVSTFGALLMRME